MNIRRSKLDILFSNLVRRRANWACQVCGRYFPEGQRQGLHCSHHFSRRKKSIRFSPINASAACFSCHQTLGENPVLFHDWIKGHLGDEKFAALKVQAERIVRLKKHDLAEIHENLKAAWASEELEFSDPMPEHFGAQGEAA